LILKIGFLGSKQQAIPALDLSVVLPVLHSIYLEKYAKAVLEGVLTVEEGLLGNNRKGMVGLEREPVRPENSHNDEDFRLQLNHCQSLHYIVRHEAVQKMREGPSESACRS
jgi:hypothetical protein